MWQRVIGLIMIAIGIVGIGLSIVGLATALLTLNELSAGLEESLTLTINSVETVRETLLLTKDTITHINEGLGVVEETSNNVSTALDETQPLLEQVSQVVGEDLPASLEAIQSTMPALEQAASAIDDTLRTLSAFERSFFGISLDLGVEYDPDQPFDESVSNVGESLEGVPGRLRLLRSDLDQTQQSLDLISGNLAEITGSLQAINENANEVEPLLDDYIAMTTEIGDSMRQARERVARQIRLIKIVLASVMVWMGLTQAAPLYLGWELLSGRRHAKGQAE